MAIRKYKPTTPGRRGSSVADFAEITRSTPEKSLLRPLSKTGGRNNQGRITTRHIGGGHKRQYRVIDFRRNDKDGVQRQGRAHRVRPEPHGAHRAAALRRRHQALHPRAEQAARRATSSSRARAPTSSPATTCRCATSPPVPSCTPSSCRPGGGAKMARSAGASVRLVAKDGPYAQLRLPSGEIRNVDARCRATDRRGRQRRAVEHQLGQGRPQALEGRPPDRPRCRHEPGRPPARWW